MPTDQPGSDPVDSDALRLGEAPAAALRDLQREIGAALALAGQNAVAAQQQGFVIAQAALTQGIVTLYSVDSAALGMATKAEFEKTS